MVLFLLNKTIFITIETNDWELFKIVRQKTNDEEAASIVKLIIENLSNENNEPQHKLTKREGINELKQEIIKLNYKVNDMQFDLLIRIAIVLFALLLFMIVNLYTK